MAAREQELLCPGCGARFHPRERFCAECRLPLISAAGVGSPPELSERHRQARMIKPQLAEGPLVRVCGAHNVAEAEFIQNLLLEAGVPSLLKRSAGFDVPDMLAAGPRDIMVAAAGLDTAREVLLEAELIATDPPPRVVTPGRLLGGILLALAAGVLIVWLISLAGQ